MLKKIILTVLVGLLVASVAHAEELTGTLKKIKDTGIVVMGHRESSIPFSYYDSKMKPVGYAQDYSELIVEAIKKKVGNNNLEVKYIPVTSQNRIPLLQNGTYDFECGSTTNNMARQEQVDFSNTFFIVGTRILVGANSGIKDFADLKGKNVVVTAGTTSEVLLNIMNDKNDMKIRIISAKDHGDSFRTVESGRAVAFFIDDALLAGERAKSKTPANWAIVGTPQSYEAYGCMLRKGDTQFKDLIDTTIKNAQQSGVAKEAYDTWFTKPIPPKNMNMGFPISEEMIELFKSPNDKAYQ